VSAGEPASCLSGITATSAETSTPENREMKSASLKKTILVMSGGEGYVDFRLGQLNTCICVLNVFRKGAAVAYWKSDVLLGLNLFSRNSS